MKLKRASLALVVPVTALAAAALPAVSASAAPVHTVKVPCHAWVSNSKPKDYSTEDVWVATAPHAAVTTVAHYRTTHTTHKAEANRKGDAEIAYRISDATPGYKVNVTVTVTSGHHSGSCFTSFTPKHR